MSILVKLADVADQKIPVLSLEGEIVGEVKLPKSFTAPLREDLVRRAFVHLLSHSFQPKGSWKGSGHKYSVESLGAGYGMARIARIKGEGTPKRLAGGFVPSSVGGRPTHPPKPEKKIHKKINKKERLAATLCALAFTSNPEWVKKRGHRLPEGIRLPLVTTDDIEAISKTKELKGFMIKIGLKEELDRCSKKKIRPGKGKRRGRKYKVPVGPLVVFLKDRGISKATSSLQGVDAVSLNELSVLHLAPGGHPGRLVVWSKGAIQSLDNRFGIS